MKGLNRIFILILMSFIMLSFSQCSSAQRLQKKAPTTFGEVYCQSWIGGIEGAGSGINIFIPIEDASIVLDSVYFRGKVEKLVTKPQNAKLYIGYFMSDFNQPNDAMIGTGDDKNAPNKEQPKTDAKIPFELKENECVVSYKDGEATKYFKLENVIEKESIPRPSAPPNRNK